MRSRGRGLALGAAVAFGVLQGAGAQEIDLTGYGLGVGTHAQESPLLRGGSGLVGRFRLMPVLRIGQAVVDVAYEHVVTRTPQGGGISITTPGGTAGSTDWLPLDWSVRQTDRTTWFHRLDRLSVSVDAGPFEITAGRQAISWATTLFLTPADPFSPFDPSDPFREYRGGVDALRIKAFPGPFSELEMVLRGADTPDGAALTALVRGQRAVGDGVWSVGAWGGAVHGKAGAAAFAVGSIGATAIRTEATLRDDPAGGTALRMSIGADRFFRPAERDMYVVLELQHDAFGAADAGELLPTVASLPYRRGEMQALGSNTFASQVSYQIHPLVSLGALGLTNLDDFSQLLSVSGNWSTSGSTGLSVGMFVGRGNGTVDPVSGLASEYGAIPRIAYVSANWFF